MVRSDAANASSSFWRALSAYRWRERQRRRRIRFRPVRHELVHHGVAMSDPSDAPPDDQRAVVKTTVEAVVVERGVAGEAQAPGATVVENDVALEVASGVAVDREADLYLVEALVSRNVGVPLATATSLRQLTTTFSSNVSDAPPVGGGSDFPPDSQGHCDRFVAAAAATLMPMEPQPSTREYFTDTSSTPPREDGHAALGRLLDEQPLKGAAPDRFVSTPQSHALMLKSLKDAAPAFRETTPWPQSRITHRDTTVS
jgi:hypothetical protein